MNTVAESSLRHVVLAAAAAAMLALATNGTCAGLPDARHTQLVSYRDLDVDTPEGAAHLYRRLKIAVRDVCRAPTIAPWARDGEMRCRQEALAAAVAQAKIPLLTELHDKEQTPRLAKH
jgi:UrcA family protein